MIDPKKIQAKSVLDGRLQVLRDENGATLEPQISAPTSTDLAHGTAVKIEKPSSPTSNVTMPSTSVTSQSKPPQGRRAASSSRTSRGDPVNKFSPKKLPKDRHDDAEQALCHTLMGESSSMPEIQQPSANTKSAGTHSRPTTSATNAEEQRTRLEKKRESQAGPRKALSQLNSDPNKTSDRLGRLEKDLASYAANLTTSKAGVSESITALETVVEAARKRVTSLDQNAGSTLTRLSRIEGKLGRMTDEHVRTSSRLGDVAALRQEVAICKADLAHVTSQLAEAEKATATFSMIDEKCEIQASEIEALRKDLNALKATRTVAKLSEARTQGQIDALKDAVRRCEERMGISAGSHTNKRANILSSRNALAASRTSSQVETADPVYGNSKSVVDLGPQASASQATRSFMRPPGLPSATPMKHILITSVEQSAPRTMPRRGRPPKRLKRQSLSSDDWTPMPRDSQPVTSTPQLRQQARMSYRLKRFKRSASTNREGSSVLKIEGKEEIDMDGD